jgi:DNA-binding CsgD family transcriptional regulator
VLGAVDNRMDRARDPGDPLEFARRRRSPPFYVIDDRLNVIFRSDGVVSDVSTLPPAIEVLVRGLAERLIVSNEASLLGVLSSSEVVRVLRLDAGDSAQHFAVVLERFAARSSVARAAKRFALSTREAEVLNLLMRGEGTNAIARHLGIGSSTVNEHVRAMGYKMNLATRSEIVAAVFRLR